MRRQPLEFVQRNWVHLVHPLALIPLVLLVWDFFHNNLTANPIQAATLRTGLSALVLLVLSLSCTPLNMLFGWKRVLNLRRPLGLYAFMYAAIHMIIFVVIDYGLDTDLIWDAVAEKPYVMVGSAALLILIPLAITSTKGWMKRLGKRWKQLHRLVYIAAPLAILHFIWEVKADYREPAIYGTIVACLLIIRLPAISSWIKRTRYSPKPRQERVERA